MSKKIFSLAIAVMAVFSMAAIANAGKLCLKADVPEGKTLKAYSFMVTYDPATVAVEEMEKLGFTMNAKEQEDENGKRTGVIKINGIDVDGVVGPAVVEVVKIKVKGSAKDAKFTITPVDFGASADDKFEAEANARVEVVEE
jgi:hypothetical protein